MMRYLLARVAAAFGVLSVVAVLVFGFLHLIPGDPAAALLSGSGGDPSPEAVASLRAELGLDEPLPAQFADYLAGLATADLGTSLADGADVAATIGNTLPRSVELILVATTLSALIGVPAGTWAARRSGGRVDRFLSALTSLGVALPVYVIGVLAVYVFALRLGVSSAGGYVAFGEDPWLHMSLLILPTCTLAVNFAATIARMTRTAVLEVQAQDYVRTAWSKGISGKQVLIRHVVRNALPPVVTLTGMEMGVLLGSTVVVERVFNWPGIGTLLVTSVTQRDYPMVQGIVLCVSVLFVFVNLAVDIVNRKLDPRAGDL